MKHIKTGILLTLLAGVGGTGAALAQTTYNQPYIADFSPASGPAGTVITVTGSGFTGSNAAWIGSGHDAAYSVISDSQMTVTVPADGTTGQVALFNPLHAAWSGSSFTVTAASTAGTTGAGTTGTGGGTTASGSGATTTASVTPTVSLRTSSSVITSGQSTTLTWSSSNATQCSGVGAKRWGSKSVAPTQSTTYSETCSNSAGSKTASVTVTVTAAVTTPAPTVTLTAGSSTVTAGQATTLSWTSSNATSCSGVGTGTSGGTTVAPASSTTYTETCTGAGGSKSASTTVTVTPARTAALSVRVNGNHFIDGAGQTLQLRGVNLSGLEFVAMQGWSPSNPWGGQTGTATPDFNAVKSWGTNAVRIPLNEASWLGLTCTDTSGNVLHADPGSNYQSALLQTVQNATAAGLYVILDLHWTAPGGACPLLQTQMADSDHALTFWSQVASAYKGYPNVLFELFNEPFFNFEFSGSVWPYLMLGTNGSFTGYPATSNAGNWQDIKANWSAASMQAMLNTVRATGATNVVLIGSDGYTQDLSGWVATHPTDPLGQMGATWHAYPTYGATLGSAADALPNFGTQAYTSAQNILTAGFPVVVTEYGDHNTAGTVGAPMAQTLLEWADPRNVSYFGWTWDPWGINDNDLIKDGSGTPTDGFGVYVKAHYLCAATGSTDCP
jgi:hypothetical protein